MDPRTQQDQDSASSPTRDEGQPARAASARLEILFATHLRTWGGGERWMLDAAVAMARRGHGVCVAAPTDASLLHRARVAGLDTLTVPFVRDFDPRSFFRVWRHCRRRRVQVVCLNMDRVLRVAGLAARLAGVRVVLPRRGSEFPLKGHLNYRFQYGWVATGLIVNSEATAQTLTRGLSWRPRGQIHLLYNGVDLARFAPVRPGAPTRGAIRAQVRSALGLQIDDLVLISIGELTGRKNVALLLHTLPRLLQQAHQLQLLVVGSGPEAPALRRLADDAGVAARVHFLGFRDDVPALLAASDLLVHCARVEGFCFAVAEAGAAGLPAVAPAVSSLPEIVVDGQTGALYRDDDGEDLARAVQPYLNDAGLRQRHGAAGRERIEQRFELERQMHRLEAIFHQELAGAG